MFSTNNKAQACGFNSASKQARSAEAGGYHSSENVWGNQVALGWEPVVLDISATLEAKQGC